MLLDGLAGGAVKFPLFDSDEDDEVDYEAEAFGGKFVLRKEKLKEELKKCLVVFLVLLGESIETKDKAARKKSVLFVQLPDFENFAMAPRLNRKMPNEHTRNIRTLKMTKPNIRANEGKGGDDDQMVF
ncbi:hypothetical protein PPACK8108_LOCUS10320 [Phakopsora pachyrhizi]|uniref:Uncharacterized protein n=1 Tax=Phakopsora pachyrhizi TaxID=170000 RepID=A0AAV0AY30_PHAPC|nr:hypothetical protein PPACK8108_LOCUS10320 [Phakopsora pachyrhizi]